MILPRNLYFEGQQWICTKIRIEPFCSVATNVMLQVGIVLSCSRFCNQVAYKRCATLPQPLSALSLLHNDMLRYAPSWNGTFLL